MANDNKSTVLLTDPPFRNFGEMHREFIKYLEDKCGVSQDQRFLLAVSGGVDSIVLAALFRHYNIDHGIAHMNFSLRAEESDEDASFVKDLAERKDVPFFLKKVDTQEYAKQSKLSIQEAARVMRYNWLEELCREKAFDYIVLGHHRDDEVESFFINLLRGTGIRGLGGYEPRSGNVIRPLLFAGREEIQDYAEQVGLSWREDSSNVSLDYLRNKVRHELLPGFYVLRSGAREKLIENIDRFRSEAALLDIYTKRPPDELDGPFSFRVPAGMPEQALPAFIISILAGAGFNFSQACSMAESRNSSESKYFRSASHEVSIRNGEVNVRKVEAVEQGPFIIRHVSDTGHLPIPLKMEIVPGGSAIELDQGLNVAFLDADRLEFPLELRRRKDGDRFRPLGLDGSKKLSDFLMGLKLEAFEKDEVWLLTSGGRIAWVIGYRIDHRFRVNANTNQVLKVVLKQ